MANHLTPEELSKEIGIDREEVIRICVEEHVPIYHGKIDKTLFQAQLAANKALPPAALAARARRFCGTRRGRPRPRLSTSSSSRSTRACARPPASSRGAASSSSSGPLEAATEARSASIRSITGVSVSASSGAGKLAALGLRREKLAQLGPVLAAQLGRIELALEPSDQLLCERELLLASPSSRRPPRRSPPGSSRPLRCRASRARARRPSTRIRQSFSLPASTNEPMPTTPSSRIASSRSAYGRRCASVPDGHEVVGAVEVDRIDLVGADEARDLDRARGVALLERLELLVLDRDELALDDLPAADELVRADLDVVDGAPALLLDRRQALTVQHPELHVRLPRRRRGRRREPDRNADEPEADRSVPRCAHE